MTLPDHADWREILRYLRKNHSDICRQWFEELEPVSLTGGVLTIRAKTSIQSRYLSQRCVDEFTQAAQIATGALVGVVFIDGESEEDPTGVVINTGKPGHEPEGAAVLVGPQEDDAAASADNDPQHAGSSSIGGGIRKRGMRLGDDDEITLSPDYSFDEFVTGPGNRLAYAAAKAVSGSLGDVYNPLFVHGGVGLGKTHLLQAICQSVMLENPQVNICYLSCDTFMNQFYESVQNGQMNGFRNRYRHVDLLLIDDIHFLASRNRTQEEFFHTFNTLYQSGKQIVLSSDSPPEEIPELEERLVSRFKCGLVTSVAKPCYDTRVAIVRKKASMRGMIIPDDAVCHIAAKLESNIRELEGALNKVQALAEHGGIAITLELVRRAMGRTDTDITAQLTIEDVIDVVTDYFGVKLSDLQSKRRHRSVTWPRQVCMYLARKHTRYSLEEIGGYFGGRDHTTVMHAIKAVDAKMAKDSSAGVQVKQVDARLVKTRGSEAA